MTARITRIAAATKPIVSSVSIWSVPGEWGAKARPSYTRALDAQPLPAIRGAARVACGPRRGGAIAAAFAVPLLRRRARIPAPVTVAACAGGPARRSPSCGLARAAATWPSSRCRCGPSRWPTSFPTTTRSACGAGCAPATRSSSTARSGSGGCPTSACSVAWPRCARVGLLNHALTWVHWLWFLEPYVALALHPGPPSASAFRAPRAGSRPSSTSAASSTSRCRPRRPWWASEQGAHGRAGAADHGRGRRGAPGGSAWPAMYGALGGNPWAAMPSLHFATSLIAADSLAETGSVPRARVGWAYALTPRLRPRLPGRALRHRSRRRSRRWRSPCGAASRSPSRSSSAVNRGLQRLERLANG